MPIKSTAAGQKDPFVGTILADKYEILSICGRGGMGLVYKAKQQLIDRIVAIKVLKADLLADEQSVKRFQLEARAASRLKHPNVITVHDFGVVDATGQPYLVMDFMEGESLADIIKRDGRLNVRRAIPIFMQACSALEHAHRQHVIHRDVKPSNIVLVRDEEQEDVVKVVDFGIAKLTAVAGQESMHLTKTGEVFGSPIYMSPEQCMGNPLDARSDIYSLGATMYESLVGFPPLVGKTLVDTMSKHINETPPSLRATWPELCVPESIERVIMKALEKNKDLRYDSMLEMKEALEFAYKRLLAEQDGEPEPVASHSSASRMSSSNMRGDSLRDTAKSQMGGLRTAGSRPSQPPQAMLILIGLLFVGGVAFAFWNAGSKMVGTTANGIVYYLKEQPDGGVVHICTVPGRNLLKLTFTSLDKAGLKGVLGQVSGAAVGAVWTIGFHKGDSGLILDSARFDSGFDEPVQSADQLVRHHYASMAEGNFKEAYEDFSPDWRKHESASKFESNNAKVHYSQEAFHAPTYAIKIVDQSKEMVKLMLNLKYFTGANDEYYRFTIRKYRARWQIDSADPVKKDEWEAI
jgi:serine/threonine protein kinase